jgi:hypothetical protein
MSLTDKLTAEKAGLESYLDSERGAKLEQNQLDRLEILYSLLGINSNSSGSTVIGTTPTRFDRTSSTSSATLLASNTSRKTAAITNESTAILYILYGDTAAASSTNYTYPIPPIANGIPSTLIIDDYSGIITGVWASANGFARVTEVT